ncbi:hypothetical protein [Pseudoramibacter sp.]|jgi:hypothetical protein|uniref:hypothetical protein n=1 Tax=Pseudoramibacter sp. TaxID=2034862 RepID=UPI0025ED060B|nr:hypothetical protein [Pseudoramibacter sp.]MCH4071830.1 hypothetical protein [Pseudoramibacter sp.]MCH4105599.1 hypothetical protein [Pseudoramibacter sp.]
MMKYQTVVLDYNPKAANMAEAIEEQANALAAEGWAVLSFSVTPSGKAILLAQRETPEETHG